MKMILIILVISLIEKSWCDQLYLSVKENTKLSNPIGNLQSMIKNQTKKWPTLQFKQFNHVKTNDNSMTNLIKLDKNNGDLWLQFSVDREEICKILRSCNGNTIIDYIFSIDSTLFKLKLEILDLNDNVPSFNSENKQIEIPEGTSPLTEFSLPVAKDEDSETFGVERYELKPISNNDDFKKYFELFIKKSSKQPYLRVIGDLDRESIPSFEFYLYAIDGGNNQDKCKIKVKIGDINDNTPQWNGLPYREKILECSTKKNVKLLMAEDRDDKLNSGGQITFKISDNSGENDIISKTFYISENTLYFSPDSLRLLGECNITVPIIAIDGGGRSNETTVEIEIIDCNDHVPTITIDSPIPTVSENDNTVRILTSISVTDEDFRENSEFNCNLNDTNHVILYHQSIMDSQSRKGRTKIFKLQTVADMAFDRETTPRYCVEITCVDTGNPQMSSSSVVTIYITDQNDNKPKFDLEFLSFSVSEDAKVGSDVGRVLATDADINPNNMITYSIVGDENTCQTFTITNQGQIQLSQSIDREKIDRYKLKIIAIDSGKPSLNDSCDIGIMVLDVNDCRPEIPKEHHFTIVESHGKEMIHKNFGKLNATDQDLGVNGSLTYKVGGTFPNSSPVRVTHDGLISISGVIDRERHDRIETEVLVIDGGYPSHTSTTTIIFDVLDVNDNKPKFISPNRKFNNYINVSLDMAPGSIIYQLNATDPDKEANGTIDFSLSGPESLKKLFSVHPDGQIRLNEKLKLSQTLTQLSVQAKDRGTPLPLGEVVNFYIRYMSPKLDKTDVKRKIQTPRGRQNNYESNNQRNGNVAWSNIMMLIYFLSAAVFLIIVGIGGTFLYLWCRDQEFCQLRNSDKHVSSRDLHGSSYHKNTTKGDKSQSIKSSIDVNNQLLRTRNDSYQVVESPQLVNYASLLKTIGGTPIDQAYQFRTMIQCGNYSDFHARSSSPVHEKDSRELSPFTDGWDDRHQFAGPVDQRNRNQSDDSPDNVFYNDNRHMFTTGNQGNFADSVQFTTPSQSRRSANIIQSKNDLGYKPKVNYVASSFV